MFTKKDLRNGDVCVQRDGDAMIYTDCLNGVFIHKNGYDTVSNWNDSLCVNSEFYYEKSFDIMKVYRPKEPCQCQFLKGLYTKGELVFDRERDCSVLDKEEREYLSAVIKPFMDKVDYIVKVTEKGTYTQPVQYIRIRLKDNDIMTFPNLRNDTMYKGMEVDKRYTLSDLDL